MDGNLTILSGTLNHAAQALSRFTVPGSPAVTDGELASLLPHVIDMARTLVRLYPRLLQDEPALPGTPRAEDVIGDALNLERAADMCRGLLPAVRGRAEADGARAAELAWTAGTADARAARTPYGSYTPDRDGFYADMISGNVTIWGELARALLDTDRIDDGVAAAAALAYADAYGLIAGTAFPGESLRYQPSQPVITGTGRQGILTGECSRHGHPMITFAGSAPQPLTRAAIRGPVVLEFGHADEAIVAAAGSRRIQAGDVLLLRSDLGALIQAGPGEGVLELTPQTASMSHGRYTASFELALVALGEQPEPPPAGAAGPLNITAAKPGQDPSRQGPSAGHARSPRPARPGSRPSSPHGPSNAGGRT